MRGLRITLIGVTLCTMLVCGSMRLFAETDGPSLFRIPVTGYQEVAKLADLGIDIATVRPNEYLEAYLVDKERVEVMALGFDVWPSPDASFDYLLTLGKQGYIPSPGREWTSYPTFSEMEAWLLGMETSYPGLCDVFSIGQSTNGRDLWVAKISDNVGVEEAEPEFKYVGAMHGNETLCVPLLLNLIEHLLVNYGSDPDITSLVDGREIFIMPLMNPDGYVSGSRYNAQGTDLNRDFPDFIDDPVNTPDGRATETQLMMNWQPGYTFVLSANFHTGATVVNYPYDCTWDYCPDDTFFYNMAIGYSSRNLPMYNSTSFTDGVTRGVEWYMTHGNIQDWNYWWYADFEVIIELSDPSAPPASQIDEYWDDNRDAMLYHIDLAGKGITGTVTDSVSGLPLAADIEVAGITMNTPVHTDPDHGNYVRPLYTGSYDVTYSAYGYTDETLTSVPVTWEQATVRDVQLTPIPANPALDYLSVSLDDSSGGDGDGVAEPGETVDLTVTLENIGIGTATNVSATLSESDPYITVTQNSSAYPDIPQQSSGASLTPYTISVSAATPEMWTVAFTLNISADGISDTDGFNITISGDIFWDEMENGDTQWTHYAGQGTDDWAVVTDSRAHSPTHSWFSSDANVVKDDYLITNAFELTDNGEMTFWHRYNMESGYDGCVIEISVGGSLWTDLGSHITQGGYNDSISGSSGNPIGGRSAWSGDSGSIMSEVVVDLSSFSGPNTQIRFRLACDSSVDDEGWYVDDVRITGESPPSTDTITVVMGCVPASGTVPFSSQFCVDLVNLTIEDRRAAARINAVLGGGRVVSNWKSGWTNLDPGETFNSCWSQSFPALGSVIGQNVFSLAGEDVTPSPYNQPPYLPSGDTAVDGCTVTAASP